MHNAQLPIKVARGLRNSAGEGPGSWEPTAVGSLHQRKVKKRPGLPGRRPRRAAAVDDLRVMSDPGGPTEVYSGRILFRAAVATKQFSCATKPFSLSTQNSGNGGWLSSRQQKRRTAPAEKTGDSQMRTLSFLLAFAFVLARPTIGWLHRMTACRVSAPSPITARRSSLPRPPSLLRPVRAQLGGTPCRQGLSCFFVSVPLSHASLAGSAQAQVEQVKVAQCEARRHQQFRRDRNCPDPRGEFVRQCAPHMVGRWAHPESVCGCLHDYAAAAVEDADLARALLRGISETGVPTIETEWVPASKRSEIGATFTKIAKPTLQCMFEPSK